MNKRWKLRAGIFLALGYLSVTIPGFSNPAPDPPPSQPGTRIELMEEQQEEKARYLQPAKPPKAEEVLEKHVGDDPLNKYMGGIPGLHLRFGGLSSGGGFGLGPEYYRTDLAEGQMHFRIFGAGSVRKWYLIETELRFPHVGGRHLALEIHGRRLDANSIDYYGPGPDSEKSGRTAWCALVVLATSTWAS